MQDNRVMPIPLKASFDGVGVLRLRSQRTVGCGRLSVWAAMLLAGVSACSGKPSHVELLQLQERCAAAATRVFESYKTERGRDPYRPEQVMNRTNHYSLTKQKCYVQIFESRRGPDDHVTSWTLMDVFDNKNVGS